jgi:hypothetical protein
MKELSERNSELQIQLDEAQNALIDKEHEFHEKLRLFQEAEALAKQRLMEQKIVTPIAPPLKSKKGSVKSFIESFSNRVKLHNKFLIFKISLPKRADLPEAVKEGFLNKQAAGMRK